MKMPLGWASVALNRSPLMPATVAAAELSFRLIERPALGVARRAAPSRRAAQTEGAAAPATT